MKHRHPHHSFRLLSARDQAGVTLIESLVALAVVAVALGAALPGLDSVSERRHVDGAAAQIETDIMHARSLAVAHNRSVRMSFNADDQGSCYVVHTGAAGDCSCAGSGVAACSNDAAVLRSVNFAVDAPLELRANVRSILFDPTKGTITPTATLRVVGRNANAVHLVVNLMGRVRTCSPSAATPGYRAC